MEKEDVYALINVPLEGMCLVIMMLHAAGVIQPGYYPEGLEIGLPVAVVVLNLCYAFLKRGWKIFLKNCLYQLPIIGVFYFVLHGNIPELVCLYGWLAYFCTKIRFIKMEMIFRELYD